MRHQAHRLRSIIAIALGFAAPAAAGADPSATYPNKPIRMLVPFSVGSQTDIVARMIGQKMLDNWGQQVVVDNRPSAGGTVAGGIVVASSPDGHTLMMVSAGHAANPALYSKLPYDTLKDFAAVSQVASVPNVLVVGKDLGVKSVKELIALARQKSGQFNFSSAGIGSGTHVNGEMFKLAAGIDVIHVPYKGAPEALNDAMTGRVQFNFSPLAVSSAYIRDGRVLALAVSTKERAPTLPNVPTVAEAGLPGFEFDQWYGLLAPGRTPKPLLSKIAGEVARILVLPDVRERMQAISATPRSSSPEAFDAFLRAEVEKLGKVIRAAGAKIN